MGEALIEKRFLFYVLVNWKTGNVRLRKSKPDLKKLSPYLIPIKVDLTIKIPERSEVVAKGEITLSKEKVDRIILAEI